MKASEHLYKSFMNIIYVLYFHILKFHQHCVVTRLSRISIKFETELQTYMKNYMIHHCRYIFRWDRKSIESVHYINKSQYSIGPSLIFIRCLKWLFTLYTYLLLNIRLQSMFCNLYTYFQIGLKFH